MFTSLPQSKSDFFHLNTGLKCWPHQDRILHVVSQQPRVVQRVLGFLQLGVHRSLLHLVLQGLKEFVQRLSGRVLESDPRGRLSGKSVHKL